jgi:diguanylate cyclase (GGDEF)-like protein
VRLTDVQADRLYILSFRQRDELAASAVRAGWQVVAARRSEGAERRFLTGGAAVAVIDARGALAEGLEAASALQDAVGANGGAMLALVSRGDLDAVPRFYDAGATHFLASPFSDGEFVQAVRFAARHAARMAGEWRPSAPADPLGWRFDLGARTMQLTPALAKLLDVAEDASARTLLRTLDTAERRAAVAALRRLSLRPATAFAHDIAGVGRVVQHVQHDAAKRRVDALIEPLGSAPNSTAAMHDALAGARDVGGTRRWIDRRLLAGGPLAVVLIALNRFEVINTAYGRAAGDALLRSTYKRIEEAARETLDKGALVTRMGGSEFLVATQQPRDRIDLAVERIAGILSKPFVVGNSIAVLGCRIAIAERGPQDDATALLRRASEALADAKTSDSATVRVADSGTRDAPVDRLASELGPAIERGEIDILFQPQVAMGDGTIVGVEALARWDHGTLGMIGADLLFAAATRADLEIALSDHIQRIVLQRAAGWPASLSGLRLSLNLTAGDIARPGFADLFLGRIDSSGFPHQRLTLEITESGLIEDLSIAADLLTTFRQAGCRTAIDDFGTGYSSLAYLKSLPLDYLKIDKKLAQDITGTARDRVVVRGVIDMARSLGLSVIAEGVETEEQLDLLAKEGCQYYQGFLCSEAVSSTALVGLLEKRA